MSSCNCCFLTCIQTSQEAGQVVWDSHLAKNFPVCCDPHSQRFWHRQKAEADVFLELSCFFYDPTDVGNLISGSSTFSKSSLNIWKFMVHVLLKSSLKNFEHYFASYQRGLITATQRLCENFMYWETLSYLQLIPGTFLNTWSIFISVNRFNQGVSRSHSYTTFIEEESWGERT